MGVFFEEDPPEWPSVSLAKVPGDGGGRSLSLGLKIIQNGEQENTSAPCMFLTPTEKRGGGAGAGQTGTGRDAAKLLTFLYDRAPGIASTCSADPLCMPSPNSPLLFRPISPACPTSIPARYSRGGRVTRNRGKSRAEFSFMGRRSWARIKF